jgi:mannose-6-phosphate isomerase-like protein (cupin superfamily)
MVEKFAVPVTLHILRPTQRIGMRVAKRLTMAIKHKHLRFGHGFRILLDNEFSQAAQMTLSPGEAEGGPDNSHQGADQWLFVVSGTGMAIVEGTTVELRAGTLLLIARGNSHEIRNSGATALKTLSIYVPPAYKASGEELPAGRP